MKTNLRYLLLLLICFPLFGCPAGKFYPYHFVDSTTNNKGSKSIKISYNQTTELQIDCGNYLQHIAPKKRGLLTFIKVISKTGQSKNNIIKSVISSKFGSLNRTQAFSPHRYMVQDTLNTLFYDLSLDSLKVKNIEKLVQNDTITVALQNGEYLTFIKKENHIGF